MTDIEDDIKSCTITFEETKTKLEEVEKKLAERYGITGNIRSALIKLDTRKELSDVGHPGEVNLKSPVAGKAMLILGGGCDFDPVNFTLPAGALPMKWVDAQLKKWTGGKFELKALQSYRPRLTKTLNITKTVYRLTWWDVDGQQQSKIEIELRVAKSKKQDKLVMDWHEDELVMDWHDLLSSYNDWRDNSPEEFQEPDSDLMQKE